MLQYYSEIYFGGTLTQFSEGTHYERRGLGSFRVAEGYTVQFFQNADGSGKKSRLLYAGSYEDQSFYGGVFGANRFDVKKTDLRNDDFITAIAYKDTGVGSWYPLRYKIPVGDWTAEGEWYDCMFDNDAIDAIEAPEGTHCQIYDIADSKNFIEFDGRVSVDLAVFDYRNKVSRIVVDKDSWEVIEDVVDWDNAKELSSTRITGTSGTIRNSSEATITQRYDASYTQENSYSRTWEIGGSLTVGASVTGSAGVPLVGSVQVTASVEASISASGGGTDVTTVTETKSIGLDIEVPANSGLEILAVYDKVKREYPTWRVLRNMRTGATIRQDAKLISYEGTDATIDAQSVPIA